MKKIIVIILLGGASSFIYAMEVPPKPNSYLELLPAEIGREVKAYNAMNKLKSFGSGPENRKKAMDILRFLKVYNPLLLNNETFVYGFLDVLADKYDLFPPFEYSEYFASLNNKTASQWFKNYSLMRTASFLDKNTIEEMIDQGAQVNALVTGKLPLLEAVLRGRLTDTDNLKLLIQKGADVNLTDKDGRSALSLAINGRKSEAVKILLSSGAKIETQNLLKLLEKPIKYLIEYDDPEGIEEIKKIISILADDKFDLKARNNEGKTVIQQMNDLWDYYKKEYPAGMPYDRGKAGRVNQIFPQIIEVLKSKGAQ